MTDKELRGIVLQKYYERRQEDLVLLTPSEFDEEITADDIMRISEQLRQDHLIEWEARNKASYGYRIRSKGSNVVEGSEPTPPSIFIDRRTITITDSSGFQIGDNNIQTIAGALQQMIQAIDGTEAPPEEKKKAKELLLAFLKFPLVTKIGGAALLKLLGL